MAWRNAKSIDRLIKQINDRFPNRSKASDGTIGDEAHQSRTSDHNAWIRGRDGKWVVSAVDITHDPAHGVDCHILTQQLIASRDRRIKYIIWSNRIIAGRDGPSPWVWRSGKGHIHHMHLSVEEDELLYDDDKDWTFSLRPTPNEVSAPPTPTLPKLRAGMTGKWVAMLQTALNNEIDARLLVDGDFGPKTDRAVRIFQREKGLLADGVVGAYTWSKLNFSQEKK